MSEKTAADANVGPVTEYVTPEDVLPKNTNRIPCRECPFARWVKPGGTGGSDPRRFIGQALGHFWLPCHMAPGYWDNKDKPNNHELIPQCAGAAIYRTNVGVADRFPATFLHAAADTEAVFASHAELLAHHLQVSRQEAEILLEFHTPEACLLDELRRVKKEHLKAVPADRRPK